LAENKDPFKRGNAISIFSGVSSKLECDSQGTLLVSWSFELKRKDIQEVSQFKPVELTMRIVIQGRK